MCETEKVRWAVSESETEFFLGRERASRRQRDHPCRYSDIPEVSQPPEITYKPLPLNTQSQLCSRRT
jgi:hypothetical protein